MTSMNDQHERKQDEELKERLRAELKTWERAFEKENGHKPTPADVKANSEINTKYKIYHKSFRAKSSSSENSTRKSEYISAANALTQITPNKRLRNSNILTPTKAVQVSDDVEAVGPTPQLNGRMLGLLDGIPDSTPLTKRRKLSWGEQLAEARKNSPKKSSPRKRLLDEVFSPDSQMQETPTKSTSSIRSRFSTPVTQYTPLLNQHAFATPAFLRPTALPIQSPQSPSLPWERIPTKIKGFSALISDFRANQQTTVEEIDHEAWEDEDELKVTQEQDSPGVAGRKPWMKRGAKRSKRRTIMRPVPQLEIPASDDEGPNSLSPTMQKSESLLEARGSPSPELGLNDDTPEDVEEPSDLEDARDQFEKHTASTRAEQIPPKKTTRKAKGGYKIGKQVSGNFVSYKIRSKGQRGRGRFGGGRFRR